MLGATDRLWFNIVFLQLADTLTQKDPEDKTTTFFFLFLYFLLTYNLFLQLDVSTEAIPVECPAQW